MRVGWTGGVKGELRKVLHKDEERSAWTGIVLKSVQRISSLVFVKNMDELP